jgi:S-adenosylmethionine synthetase
VETLVTTGLVHVAGEVRTDGYVDIPGIVRRVVNRIGYTSSETGFDGDSCGVTVSIGEQSGDIAAGSTRDRAPGGRVGRSDRRARRGRPGHHVRLRDDRDAAAHADGDLDGAPSRRAPHRRPPLGALGFLRPDGKTQVTLGYDGAVPRTVDTVVLSTQHNPDISLPARRRARPR